MPQKKCMYAYKHVVVIRRNSLNMYLSDEQMITYVKRLFVHATEFQLNETKCTMASKELKRIRIAKKEMKYNETRTATVKVRTNSSGIYAIANEAYDVRYQCAAANGQRKRMKEREK